MTRKCEHCDAGDTPVKLRRQYVHYINRKRHVCTRMGFHAEPGDWDGARPVEWEPRRIRAARKR